MKQTVVDANCFLRYLLNDIPNQAEQLEQLLIEASKGKLDIIVPQIVIFELQFALEKYYYFQKPVIIDRLQSLVRNSYLKVQNKTIFMKALKIHQNNSISLADSFILCYALEKDMDVMTFDKKLQKLVKKQIDL